MPYDTLIRKLAVIERQSPDFCCLTAWYVDYRLALCCSPVQWKRPTG